MVNVYRANRQFERGFLSNTNLNEPFDDRKNFDDMFKYPKCDAVNSDIPEGSRLIATIIYNSDNETIKIERN